MLRDKSLIPLSHQHHNALAFCVLAGRSLASDPGADNVARLCRSAVERYDIELVNHFELEEQILFPALDRLPLVEELVNEHRRMESMVRTLRSTPSMETLKDFMTLLRSHIRREEGELFEQAQQMLSAEVLSQIGRQIESRVVRVCL